MPISFALRSPMTTTFEFLSSIINLTGLCIALMDTQRDAYGSCKRNDYTNPMEELFRSKPSAYALALTRMHGPSSTWLPSGPRSNETVLGSFSVNKGNIHPRNTPSIFFPLGSEMCAQFGIFRGTSLPQTDHGIPDVDDVYRHCHLPPHQQ